MKKETELQSWQRLQREFIEAGCNATLEVRLGKYGAYLLRVNDDASIWVNFDSRNEVNPLDVNVEDYVNVE